MKQYKSRFNIDLKRVTWHNGISGACHAGGRQFESRQGTIFNSEQKGIINVKFEWDYICHGKVPKVGIGMLDFVEDIFVDVKLH